MKGYSVSKAILAFWGEALVLGQYSVMPDTVTTSFMDLFYKI